MLGDTILAAPVLDDGARARDIYLPVGTWVSGNDGASYTGPTWLRNYPAPLDVVPYFIKQ
jgi:alpha-glucosidase (family GH31 glycosyl hydrolase)